MLMYANGSGAALAAAASPTGPPTGSGEAAACSEQEVMNGHDSGSGFKPQHLLDTADAGAAGSACAWALMERCRTFNATRLLEGVAAPLLVICGSRQAAMRL